MKAYFLKLFDYDRHTNMLMLETIVKANNPAKAVQLMAHLLTAQKIWYNRCAGLPPVAGTLWTDESQPADLSVRMIDDNYTAWKNYIEGLDADDLNKIIAYKNLSGQDHANTLGDICMQVINHGTHHRAQIGQHLKSAGIEILPVTDFIAFVRR